MLGKPGRPPSQPTTHHPTIIKSDMPSASTLSVTTSDRNLSRSIAGALQDLIDPPPDALTVFEDPGDGGAEPNWRIDAYYASPPDPLELQTQLQTMLDTAIPVFSIEAVPDLNWVAISQAALPPVTAGRFTIHGSHDRDKVGNRYYGIEIEAGEAFGTAHHATTFG
ncbi:MAG: 50S ribosomal protein L11 methyltransferase, partial [Pseudomonadota bacterium]